MRWAFGVSYSHSPSPILCRTRSTIRAQIDRTSNVESGSRTEAGGEGESAVQLASLETWFTNVGSRVIACSGGIDSLLLATLAHRFDPARTRIAHAKSPAVPLEATARVEAWAASEGWALEIVESGEFGSEDYLSNPVNRCYFCKTNLYQAIDQIAEAMDGGATLMSGANTDDLGEYRPGLIAADERDVRHPYVEVGIAKETIRQVARSLGLPFAELPASPCLASRLYTGTRVTPERLRAVEVAEALVKERTGLKVVRCRVREDEMVIEVGAGDRDLITEELMAAVREAARIHMTELVGVALDAEPYRPGRAFVQIEAAD